MLTHTHTHQCWLSNSSWSQNHQFVFTHPGCVCWVGERHRDTQGEREDQPMTEKHSHRLRLLPQHTWSGENVLHTNKEVIITQNAWQQRGHMIAQLVVMSQLSNPASVCVWERRSLQLMRLCESYHGDKSTVSSLYFVCVCFTRHCQETTQLNVFVDVIKVENTGVVSIFEQLTSILRS